MTRVFVAGPIDFQDIGDVIEYRLELRRRLEGHGLTPVDQYSNLLDLLVEADVETADVATWLSGETVPDEPFVRAVRHAIEATSIETIMTDPSVVPEYTPPEVVDAMVDRDLSLLDGCDGLLAYLPEPSCGTMVEILHAREASIPVVVVSETPSHYVQHYADAVAPTIADGVDRIESCL